MKIPLFLFFQDNPKDVQGEIDVNTDSIIEKLDKWLDGFIKALPNIVVGIVVFIVMLYVARAMGNLVKKLLKNRGRQNFGEILGGFTRYALILTGIMISLTIMSPNISPADLIASLGVSSVAIGFAFKDILQNWLAGILILMRQPFKIGDQIVADGFEGTVDRIETRATIITTYDGQSVVIPNSQIYTNSVRVKTAHEFLRSQYDVGVGYDQDYLKAMKILKETVQNVEGVSPDKPVETLVWDQADSWLTIRVRWWTKSDRASVVHIWSEVILKTQQAMNDAGIDLPFPTTVEVQNAHDLKEAKEIRDEKIKTKAAKNRSIDE
ncbi:MAG: mechanosensitive ion channel family protein [Leeuwenhoekiella sp.]